MKINSDESTYKPPFSVVILDAMDAYYYADVMEKMDLFDKIEDYKKAVDVANALFVVKNYKWKSLDEMNDCDGGFDVRVYDSNNSCVYAAHTNFLKKWIGE